MNAPAARSPQPAARSAAFMLALLVGRDARAIDAPVYNPTVDANGFGSTFGWSAVGDGPPPSCWPTGQEPRLLGPLYVGDATARVGLAAAAVPASAVTNLGITPLAIPITPWEPLASALTTGDSWLSLIQGAASARIRVSTAPSSAEVPPLRVLIPPDAGAVAIAVHSVFPGAFVEAAVPGRPSTFAWNDDDEIVSMLLPTGTAAGEVVTLTSTVAGVVRTTSVTVGPTPRALRVPSVPWGAEQGAWHVTVSGVTPGSVVEILNAAGFVVGEAAFGAPMGVVPVCEAPAQFRVRVTRGNGVIQTPLLTARPDPTEIFGPVTPVDTVFNNVVIGGVPQTVHVREYPAAGNTRAVVLICNAHHLSDVDILPPASISDFYQGFDWLGIYLARRRVHTISLDCEQLASAGDRKERIVGVYDRIPVERPLLTNEPTVFIGHSFGGEGAALAADDIVSRGDPKLKGAVLLAPSSVLGGQNTDGFPVMVLNGDQDIVTSGMPFNPDRAPLRYDHSRTSPFTFVGLHQATHWAWENLNGDFGVEPGDLEAFRSAARRLILRFVRSVSGPNPSHDARAYTWGGSWPRATWSWRPRVWFSDPEALILDDFDDASANNNALGGTNTFPGATPNQDRKAVLHSLSLHDDDARYIFLTASSNLFGLSAFVGDIDVRGRDYLGVDLMRTDEGLSPATCTVRLEDTTGAFATAPIGTIEPVREYMRYDSMNFANPTAGDLMFESQVIRTDAFPAITPGLDLAHIKTVEVSCFDLPFFSIDNLRFGVD